MTFTDTQIAYLTSQRLGRLATVDRGGAPQNNPVSFGYNRALGTIDIGGYTMATSRKFANVAANPRVAFVVDDIASLDPWQVRCLEVRGHAEAIAEPTDSRAQIGGPIIRVHPERTIAFGIDSPAMPKREGRP
jgi:pyridoxamine 5'-phosphate oxidase family protein